MVMIKTGKFHMQRPDHQYYEIYAYFLLDFLQNRLARYPRHSGVKAVKNDKGNL